MSLTAATTGGTLGPPEAATSAPPPPPQPPARVTYGEYDEQGVDLSLLRWMLGLSPLERLIQMERYAHDTELILEYGRRHRQAQAASARRTPQPPRGRVPDYRWTSGCPP